MRKLSQAMNSLNSKEVIEIISQVSTYINRTFNVWKLNRWSDISIHSSAIVHSSASFGTKGEIQIGPNCRIHDYSRLHPSSGYIEIGENSGVGPFSVLYGQGGLEIGSDVLIAPHCVIIPANHTFNRREVPIRLQDSSKEGIDIGDDIWIGANCTILDGVTLGKGSVVAGGSVVTKSFPEYSIIAGVPAKKIDTR